MPEAFDKDSPSAAWRRVDPTHGPNRFYEADGAVVSAGAATGKPGKLRPSIHMPRWASRLTLIVEAVRIERLCSITDADALAEGVLAIAPPSKDGMRHFGVEGATIDRPTPAHAFAELWSSLHQADGECWRDNPEIVALTFRVARDNIDRLNVAWHDGVPA